MDYSQQMLAKAREKGVYATLSRGDLMRPRDIGDNVYHAVISVGTFTCGHVGPQALGQLVRITRPGGHICFTVREQAWEEDDYRTKVNMLETRGAWELLERLDADNIRQEGARCKVCLYKIPH